MALCLAGCHLSESAAGRADRAGGGDSRRRGQHRRPPRNHRSGDRPLGSGDLLDRVPSVLARPRPGRGQAGDQRCPHRAQGRHRPGLRSHLAAVPRSLDQECPRACLARPAHRRCRRDPPGVRPARPRPCRGNLAQGVRAAASPLAQAGRPDGSSHENATGPSDHGEERARRAGLHVLPAPASHQAAQHQPDRAPEQGGEAPRRRRRRSGTPSDQWQSCPHSPTRPRSCA